MSYDDIARVTGANLGTVRSRLHYAKRILKRKWKDHGKKNSLIPSPHSTIPACRSEFSGRSNRTDAKAAGLPALPFFWVSSPSPRASPLSRSTLFSIAQKRSSCCAICRPSFTTRRPTPLREPLRNRCRAPIYLVPAHLFMTTAIGVGTALVAGSVGLLGLGTLLLVSLVLINRRVALRQISVSLADISLQLKQLQHPTGPP